MDRRSDKLLVAFLTLAGGIGLGLLLAPKSGRVTRRWIGGMTRSVEKHFEDRLEEVSAELSEEASRLVVEIAEQLLPMFEAKEEEWDEIYRDLIEELERLPRE